MCSFVAKSLPSASARWLAAILSGVLVTSAAHADFSLNFRPNTTVTNNTGDSKGSLGNGDNDQGNSCGITGYTDTGCFWFRNSAGTKINNASQQPFRMESVAATDGNVYWHLLLGNFDDNWKQDVWIRMGTSQNYMTAGGTAGQYHAAYGTRLSDSGGFASVFNNQKNAINGGNYGQMNASDMIETEIYAGSGADPLRKDAIWTGNGSANPNRVIMRQIDNSVSGYQEFLKDKFDRKPLIYQQIIDGEINAVFQADMRGQTYSNGNTPLTIGTSTVTVNPAVPGIGDSTVNANYAYNAASEFVLKVSFSDPGMPAVAAGYNAAGSRPVVGGGLTGQNITASKYTWTAGSGWAADTGQQTYYDRYYSGLSATNFTQMPIYGAGTYTYASGSFDHANVDWKAYLDPLQSPCMGNPYCP